MSAVADPERLFSSEPDEVLRELRRLRVRVRLDRPLNRALHGQFAEVRVYVSAYQRFTDWLLERMHEARPDMVLHSRDGRMLVMDAKRVPSRAPVLALLQASGDAPFSPWVDLYGPHDGLALNVVSQLRWYLPGAEPLVPPAGHSAAAHWDVDDLQLGRFLRYVRRALDQLTEGEPLRGIMIALDINLTELGELFGVSRQAVAQWLEQGVPSDRQAKVATVAAICDLLERKLKTGRLPGVARRPAPAYGDRTMLQLIADDEHEWLLESVRESFDWSHTA
jgi:transcriptional regulator with XRE-family HTH domain